MCFSQIINIVTLGSPDGKGVFFPNGLGGAINKPTGYNETASGLDSFPASGAKVATQVCTSPNSNFNFTKSKACSCDGEFFL